MTGTRRLAACVAAWPDCETGQYHPSCCRFPKSCSATVYDPEFVTDADLEPAGLCGQAPPSWSPLPPSRTCQEPAGVHQFHVINDSCGRPEFYWEGAPEVDPERPGMSDVHARQELVNIRRLVERHGVEPADGLGVVRSTVAMVEELALRRPPR